MASSASTGVLPSLRGVTDSRYGKVTHYRGLQYATIKQRFASPTVNKSWPGKETDCTRFGPRCPQLPQDPRDLMQIPKSLPTNDAEEEDELRCANLNVTCPTDVGPGKYPVLVWLYGGSQVTSFGTAAHKLGDPGPLVAQSIEQGKPIILVTPHYRLNLFAFGDREGELNLALQDQRAALEWVRTYIDEFGGDPDNITLGGESAGAIYTHALLASGCNSFIPRAILDSACLYTIPPQSEQRCFGLLGLAEGNLQLIEMEKGNADPAEAVAATLAGAPVERIIQTLRDLDITSMWMWSEAKLQNWDDDAKVFGKMKAIMIGDCEYESVIYRLKANTASPAKIAEAFKTSPPEPGRKLAAAYGVDASNAKVSRLAMLNFLNDVRFAHLAQAVAERVNETGGTAYQYYFDQANPFSQPKEARAHHAVDLFAIFGGYDGFVNEEMQKVGFTLRENWINFIHGEEPWNKQHIYTYGPEGKTAELTKEAAAPRRRAEQMSVLSEIGRDTLHGISLRLISAADTATDD